MPAKKFLYPVFAVAIVGALSNIAIADRTATADDGREILLKDNGSWEYQSNDRFATSKDGTRVRLKDDGSWAFIGNAPMVTKEQVRTQSLEVSLGDIVSESFKEKRGKNTRYNSQTIFNLVVDVSSYSQGVDTRLSHFNLFKVSDSNGNDYPIISVTPQAKHLKPGEQYPIAVRVDSSPAGQLAVSIKNIHLHIDKAVFASDADLTFTRRADEIKKIKKQKGFK